MAVVSPLKSGTARQVEGNVERTHLTHIAGSSHKSRRLRNRDEVSVACSLTAVQSEFVPVGERS